MNELVILSPLEQDYLLRVVEAGARVCDMRQFFLWTQGQLQALLPHQVLLCMEYGPGDALRRLECIHGAVLGEDVLRQLTDPAHGLAVQAARETEVLSWVREGKSNDEIGSILGISALTVKNHLQRVYRALGVGNRAHALSRCHALRLLESEGPGVPGVQRSWPG